MMIKTALLKLVPPIAAVVALLGCGSSSTITRPVSAVKKDTTTKTEITAEDTSANTYENTSSDEESSGESNNGSTTLTEAEVAPEESSTNTTEEEETTSQPAPVTYTKNVEAALKGETHSGDTKSACSKSQARSIANVTGRCEDYHGTVLSTETFGCKCSKVGSDKKHQVCKAPARAVCEITE